MKGEDAICIFLVIVIVLFNLMFIVPPFGKDKKLQRRKEGNEVANNTTATVLPTVCPSCKHASHGARCHETNRVSWAELCGCTHDVNVQYDEITAREARYKFESGERVYGMAFDPVLIANFDKNGFQVWADEGYRFEAVRYFKRRELENEPE